MKIKNAEYIKDYKVRLTFSDGAIKIVDFQPFLEGAKNLFIPLLDIKYFKNFSVDNTTICWPNEVDFCPDVLYEIGEDTQEEKQPVKRGRTTQGRTSKIKYQTTCPMIKRRSKKAEIS